MERALRKFRSGTLLLLWAGIMLFWPGLAMPRGAEGANPFEQANKLYEQGRFKEAAAAYEALLAGNRASAEILYNLGNAYFKDRQIGRAIYSYRRAERLDPRDPDIQANLRFARSAIRGDHSVRRSLAARALEYASLNELAIAAALLLWIWASTRILVKLRPNLKGALKTPSVITAVLFLVAALWLFAALAAHKRAAAIVIADGTTARFGPLEASQIAFTFSDGTELNLAGEKGDWIQVIDRLNRAAWLKRDQVLIFPKHQ